MNEMSIKENSKIDRVKKREEYNVRALERVRHLKKNSNLFQDSLYEKINGYLIPGTYSERIAGVPGFALSGVSNRVDKENDPEYNLTKEFYEKCISYIGENTKSQIREICLKYDDSHKDLSEQEKIEKELNIIKHNAGSFVKGKPYICRRFFSRKRYGRKKCKKEGYLSRLFATYRVTAELEQNYKEGLIFNPSGREDQIHLRHLKEIVFYDTFVNGNTKLITEILKRPDNVSDEVVNLQTIISGRRDSSYYLGRRYKGMVDMTLANEILYAESFDLNSLEEEVSMDFDFSEIKKIKSEELASQDLLLLAKEESERNILSSQFLSLSPEEKFNLVWNLEAPFVSKTNSFCSELIEIIKDVDSEKIDKIVTFYKKRKIKQKINAFCKKSLDNSKKIPSTWKKISDAEEKIKEMLVSKIGLKKTVILIQTLLEEKNYLQGKKEWLEFRGGEISPFAEKKMNIFCDATENLNFLRKVLNTDNISISNDPTFLKMEILCAALRICFPSL